MSKSYLFIVICIIIAINANASKHEIRVRNGNNSVDDSWIFNIGTKEGRVFSQNGEDGVLEYIFSNIGAINKYFVEFGVENGDECCTRYLQEKNNWVGLRMDGGNSNTSRYLKREMFYPNNIVSLFEKYSVPKVFDLLVVDTDMFDYYIWHSILQAKYRARVLVAEVNSKIAPGYYGASVSAIHHLLGKYGYTLVYCELVGVNCFFISDEEISNISIKNILTPSLLQRGPRWFSNLRRSDPKKRPFTDVCAPPLSDMWILSTPKDSNN
jgi:hypothetical protein